MRSRSILIVLLFVSAMIFFLTAPRTVFLGDNAEFITAAQVFGVPHPPGFPLLVLIGKLFSYIPAVSVPLKINLLSIVSAVASLGFGFAILRRLARLAAPDLSDKVRDLASGLLLAALAFSDQFWIQAITAESYALNTFFVALLLYLLLRWWESESPRIFILAAVVFGISLANHPMMLLMAPAFVFGFLAGPRLHWKSLIGAVILVVMCLGLYALLPLISSSNPPLDWGSTSVSIHNFYDHLTRAQYGDFGVSSSLLDKGKFLVSFLRDLGGQFGVLLLFLPFGLFFVFRANPRFFAASLGVCFLNVLGIILLRNAVFDFEARYFYTAYYEPTFFILFIYCAVTLLATADLIVKRVANLKRYAPPALLLVSFLLVLATGLRNHSSHALADFRFIDDYSKAMLESMEPNGVLLTSFEGAGEDTWLFSLLYQQAVLGVRPDVEIVGYVDIFKTKDRQEVNDIYRLESIGLQRDALVGYAEDKFEGRSIYATFIVDPLPSGEKYWSPSNGYVYRLLAKNESAANIGSSVVYEIDEADEAILMPDFAGRDVLSYYYIARATLLVRQGDLKASQAFYIKAINTDSDPTGLDISSYRPYRQAILESP